MHRKDKLYNKYIKRLLDVICALLAIGFFCWLYAIIAILVRIKMGSPIIFRQERPGRIDPKTGKEKIFMLYKFRSMTDARDNNGELLPASQRLTKFGRILRATSLDELPEAINILIGDMSVIGPRPLLVEYLPYYTEEEAHRHDIRPGLSGWAQVNGRNVTGWDERLQQDLYYVEHCSFFFDIKIVAMTILKTIKRSDIIVGAQHGEGHGRLDVVRKDRAVRQEYLQKK